MKKTFLSIPLLVGFVVLLSGLFYVHNSLTKHNFGFSYSTKRQTEAKIVSNASEDLRVLSYNVHGVPHAQDPWCDNLVRIGKVLKNMREQGTAPHVIAIQEGFHEKIHDLIRLSGYPYAEQGPTGENSEMTSGLWILSEFPIIPLGETIYKTCATWDCLANKGVQHATIAAPGLDIQIYNTHMNSYSGKGDFWTSDKSIVAAKLEQIRHFHKYFTETHVPDLPSLVMGDFNFRPGDVVAGFFKKTALGFFNAAEVILGIVPKIVDHQFFVPGTHVNLHPASWETVFSDKQNSDHLGVLVSYRRK